MRYSSEYYINQVHSRPKPHSPLIGEETLFDCWGLGPGTSLGRLRGPSGSADENEFDNDKSQKAKSLKCDGESKFVCQFLLSLSWMNDFFGDWSKSVQTKA